MTPLDNRIPALHRSKPGVRGLFHGVQLVPETTKDLSRHNAQTGQRLHAILNQLREKVRLRPVEIEAIRKRTSLVMVILRVHPYEKRFLITQPVNCQGVLRQREKLFLGRYSILGITLKYGINVGANSIG